MDPLAAVAMSIKETANPTVVVPPPAAAQQELPARPDVTDEDRQAADAVFTTNQTDDPYAVPATLLAVSASIATLKSVAIDERKRADEQEEEEVPPRVPKSRREER